VERMNAGRNLLLEDLRISRRQDGNIKIDLKELYCENRRVELASVSGFGKSGVYISVSAIRHLFMWL
jgi:hypothetical protein